MLNFFALTTALALGPAVNVEVSVSTPAESEALRGWLSARLMEEGYDLAPTPQDAATSVQVTALGEGITVAVRGEGRRNFAVEAGPRSVQRLEVLHRVIQGVDATLGSISDRGFAPTMAVQFAGPVDEALLSELANAARDGGVRLSGYAQDGDTLVCIASRGGLAEIGIGPAAAGCAPAQVVAAVGTLAGREKIAAQLVARTASASDDRSSAAQLPAPLDDEAPPGVEPLVVELPPMHGPPRAEARLAAEGGVVVRGAADPTMGARMRLGQIVGFGGRFELAVVPSRGASVRVVDTYMLAGPDWQMSVGQRIRIVLAATAGANIHAFSSELGQAAEVSWAVALPVGASVQLRGGTRLHAMVHPGLSGVTAHHESRNVGTWERTPWRVGVSLGFSHGWRIE